MPKNTNEDSRFSEYREFLDGMDNSSARIAKRFQDRYSNFMQVIDANIFAPGIDTSSNEEPTGDVLEKILAWHRDAEYVLTNFPDATRVTQYKIIVNMLDGGRLNNYTRLFALAYVSENKNSANVLDSEEATAEQNIDAAMDFLKAVDKIKEIMQLLPWWDAVANLVAAERITMDPSARWYTRIRANTFNFFRDVRDHLPGYGDNSLDSEKLKTIGDGVLAALCLRLEAAER